MFRSASDKHRLEFRTRYGVPAFLRLMQNRDIDLIKTEAQHLLDIVWEFRERAMWVANNDRAYDYSFRRGAVQ